MYLKNNFVSYEFHECNDFNLFFKYISLQEIMHMPEKTPGKFTRGNPSQFPCQVLGRETKFESNAF